MRGSLVFAVVLFGALAQPLLGGTDLEHLRAFEEANQRFAAAREPAEFLEVALLFQAILDGGVRSGAVLFNQGNAYARAGQEGRAIACYRQAERLRPRDPVLRSNLDFVLARVNAPPARQSIVDHVLFWKGWLSLLEKAWLVALLAGAAFLSGLAALWFGRSWRRLALALLGGALLIGVSLALDVRDIRFTEHGVVVADEAVARKGNSESFAPAFNEPLAKGAEFVVLERRDDWARIRIAGALDGWIRTADAVFY